MHLLWIMNEMCGGWCTTIGARFEGWLWFVTPFCGDSAPYGVQVGSGVSEVLAAFVTSLAGMPCFSVRSDQAHPLATVQWDGQEKYVVWQHWPQIISIENNQSSTI